MGDKVERECPVCGTTYHADATRLKFGREATCSRACSYKARACKVGNREQFECGACGKTIERLSSKREPRHGLRFCSRACAYLCRKRVVDRPYRMVAVWDRRASAQKGAETRRRNAKPYPDAAREMCRARGVQRINAGFLVSKFEQEVARVMRCLGFHVHPGVPLRGEDGRWIGVVDIVCRGLAIECHGAYWHGGRWSWETPDAAQSRNLEREAVKLAAVRSAGYRPRILWEQDFKRDPFGAVLAVVR